MNESTDGRIIETAIRLFAQRGYAGTSIRMITRDAQANLGAVTYHFGGKRELYARALERCIGPMAERAEAIAASGEGDALARLEAVVLQFFEYLQERPELPQLMLQEAVAGRTLPPGPLALIRRVLAAITRLVEEGQAAGRFRSGDARLMAISVVSQPLHLTLAGRLVVAMDPMDQAVRQRLFEHARAFIREGLLVSEAKAGEAG